MIHLWGWVGPPAPQRLKALASVTSLPWEQARYLNTPSFSLGMVWQSPQTTCPLTQSGHEITAWAGHKYPTSVTEGDYACLEWQTTSETLILTVDPFGGWPIFYARVGQSFYFATELKTLLQISEIPCDLDLDAIYHYLVFSFLPGDRTPIRAVQRLTVGQKLQWRHGSQTIQDSANPWLTVTSTSPSLEDLRLLFSQRIEQAVTTRISAPHRPGLYLSGGLDSSAVGCLLRQSGIHPLALSLDFGKYDSELSEARQVAQHLDIPLHQVKVPAPRYAYLRQLVWELDLPYGDPVTWPQYCLAQAAHAMGLNDVFNGEGGDQLFGGWTNKPMIATQVYAPEQNPTAQYLRVYHRFYGEEQTFFSPGFTSQLKKTDMSGFLEPYLGNKSPCPFFHQLRLTDLYLKGCYNIMPRALRIASSHGLVVHMPLFDRRLAQFVFSLPPEFKLQGAEEKFMLKWLLQAQLPESIVYRRKAGMNVPVNTWLFSWQGKYISHQLFNRKAIQARGLFRYEAVKALLKGENHPAETRKRRLGEKWWALVMLEIWLQVFVDGKGQRPL